MYMTVLLYQCSLCITLPPLQIQRPMERFRKHATAVILGLAVVQLGMFILMYVLLSQLKTHVRTSNIESGITCYRAQHQ